ncbi:MAG: outer membrane lipoprotein-sorting protein [Spirochaetales bacterium]|nr:outer membrane lipoprotein-sorting protein [Spirochaetales bacterium]
MKKILSVIIILFLTGALFGQTAEEIIKRMESNQIKDTAYSEGKIIVKDRFGEKITSFNSWTKGEELSLIEFTSRAERGQKILRTEDVIYVFFPDAEEVMPIGGAALRDSVVGSDLSYEDMTGDKGLLDSYDVALLGSEAIDGHDCFHITMKAKSPTVPYPKQDVWVDKKIYAWRLVRKYSLSDRLIKEIKINTIENIEGSYIPMDMTIQDKLKKNSSTRFIIEKIQFNIKIDESFFSLEELY